MPGPWTIIPVRAMAGDCVRTSITVQNVRQNAKNNFLIHDNSEAHCSIQLPP